MMTDETTAKSNAAEISNELSMCTAIPVLDVEQNRQTFAKMYQLATNGKSQEIQLKAMELLLKSGKAAVDNAVKLNRRTSRPSPQITSSETVDGQVNDSGTDPASIAARFGIKVVS